MNKPPKISFLASHGGSSAQAIIDAIKKGDIDAETGILITNNDGSAILLWCMENHFPVYHVSEATHPGQSDAFIKSLLEEAGTDIVACSGYMKKVGSKTLERYAGKILNIHPALLPKYGGVGMYGDAVHEAVLAAGEKESGATVHVVTAEYDEGPIIGQSHVDIGPDDTVKTLKQRVQVTEPGLYIECLKKFLAGQ